MPRVAATRNTPTAKNASAALDRRQRSLKRLCEAFLVVGIEEGPDIGLPALPADLHAGNADLVVPGDVEPRRVFALAQQTYGTLARRDTPERERPQSPVFNSETRVSLKHPAIHETTVQILYRAPSRHQNADTAYALEVLEEIMGGGPTSRLYKSLVVDQKIAVSAGISYGADAWDDAQIWLYATPAHGVAPEEVEQALYAEFRKLIESGVSEAELQDAKTRMEDSAVYARDSLTGPAMVIGRALATGSSLDDVEYWPARINDVTREQVQAAAQAYLNPDYPIDTPPVFGVLMPEQAAEEQAPDVPAQRFDMQGVAQ